MVNLVKNSSRLSKATPPASWVLNDYSYWLTRYYGGVGNYLTNAKTFLRTVKDGGTISSQLDSYMEEKSFTMKSILRRFKRFLEEKGILFVINDLHEKKLPLGNIYVKIFLASRKDRLKGDLSLSTYATILNQFFRLIDDDLRFFNKKTAERFILSPALSDYTKRLYKSVVKNFCDWSLLYQNIADRELSKEQRIVKKGLSLISSQSMREISSIKVSASKNQLKRYHKDSLSEKQRTKLLSLCGSGKESAIISLMAWNGLRTVEVIRLSANDCDFKGKKIAVWGKGKSSRSKELIKLFAIPRTQVRNYMKESRVKSGRMFPGLTKKNIEQLIRSKFEELKILKRGSKYTPHSLRHTTGQIMYDKGVPLEFIQKTLRHSVMETTMVYAQKAIDRKYFRAVPDNI